MIHRSLILVALSQLFTGGPCDLGASEPAVPGYERAARQGLSNSIQGSLLASELGCTACHHNKNAPLKTAPSLAGVRHRLSLTWVRDFLEHPQASKPGTTMPHLLGKVQGQERASTINRLIHYLSSLDAPPDMFDLGLRAAVQPTVPRYWEKGDSQRGAKLYHSIGCIACHPLRDGHGVAQPSRLSVLRDRGYDDAEIAEIIGASGASAYVPEVPHPDLAGKYSKQSLAVFLFDPDRFRPAARMPNMKLAPDEAADLVAFLTANAPPHEGWPDTDRELAEEGRALFEKIGCVQCHTPNGPAKPAAPDWSSLRPNRGCLAEEPQPADYGLTERQRNTLRRHLGEATTPKTTAQVSLLRFNCLACHRRDGTGGVGIDRWHHFETAEVVDIGDEGRIPPTLDGVGRKLQNKWMAKVLNGEGDIRPFLQIRMPVFRHADVQALPSQLETVDGGNREKAEDIFPRVKPEAALAIANTGCVQCHTMRSEQLPGVIGVEITGLTERLRPEWFREFLKNPAALKPRTRMPTFFPNGQSSRPDLLGGNVEEQISSLWWYLADSDGVLPEKLANGRVHNFELKPTDTPIILRTFFDGVGTHAICVGFPQGVHLAFDGRQIGPRLFWKGRFLDAHGTWYDRFVPPTKPLGTDIVSIVSGPGAHSDQRTNSWPDQVANLRMLGYRLVDGVPTFRYQVGKTEIHDRMTPRDGGFVRHIEIATAGEKPVWIQLAAGQDIHHQGANVRVGQLHLSGKALTRAEVVGAKPRRIVISTANMPSVISIDYRW